LEVGETQDELPMGKKFSIAAARGDLGRVL